MIQYSEAIHRIKIAAIKSLGIRMIGSSGVETLDLLQAEGRVLAEELRSPEAVPSFDNSSMDGFAVRSPELMAGPNSLRVLQQIFAGDLPQRAGVCNGAIQIMTGAPMPGNGFDAVVKVEDTVSRVNDAGERMVEIRGPVEPGQFVREIGEDFQKGNLIANPGTRVDSKLLMSAAAVGLSRVSVIRRPKVWVIATGKEVVEYDAPSLVPGEIRNSSSPYLVNELKRLGCEVVYQGIIRDDVAEFEACVKSALVESVDLIVSTGAVSMGVHDFIKESVERLGGITNFHKVAIRPGKPVLFAEFKMVAGDDVASASSGRKGEFGGPVFFGLPGNPISTAVGVQFFVKPYLDVLLRASSEPVYGVLEKSASKPEGLRCFFKARWWVDSLGVSRVEVLDGQASFMVHSLLKANAWVVLPEAVSTVDAGTVLEVWPLG